MRRTAMLYGQCAALALLAGCGHTLGFGTATKFGLDISQQADQTVDVTMGYDRAEVASIPAPKNDDADAVKTQDTYAVLGLFDVRYGNPWTDEALVLHQFFATGWAAHQAANDPNLQKLFGTKAREICGRSCEQTGGE